MADLSTEAVDTTDDTNVDADEAAFEGISWDDGEEVSDDSSEESTDDVDEAQDDDTEDDTEAESDRQVDEDTDSEEESEDEDEDSPELSEAEQRKANNDAAAKARIEAKKQREDTLREQQQAYIDEARQAEDPALMAIRENAVEIYNLKVERNTENLTNAYNRAVSDFPVLLSDDPLIQGEIGDFINSFQAQNVLIDGYGNPQEVKADFYTALQEKATRLEQLTGYRSEKQQQSKSKQKSKTVTVPTRSPKEPKVDPEMAAFMDEANL